MKILSRLSRSYPTKIWKMCQGVILLILVRGRRRERYLIRLYVVKNGNNRLSLRDRRRNRFRIRIDDP